MPKKSGRRRRNRGNSKSREQLARELALMGAVWDPSIDTDTLRTMRDKILMRMPPVNFNGVVNTDYEVMTLRLVSEGLLPNDAVELIDLLEGSGRVMMWFEVPDFDPLSENADEARLAKSLGVGNIHNSAVSLRRKMASSSKAENKRRKDFREW